MQTGLGRPLQGAVAGLVACSVAFAAPWRQWVEKHFVRSCKTSLSTNACPPTPLPPKPFAMALRLRLMLLLLLVLLPLGDCSLHGL